MPPYIHIREEQKPFSDGQITLGVVSRLERIKGMDLVVPAICQIEKTIYGHSAISGGGRFAKEYNARAGDRTGSE